MDSNQYAIELVTYLLILVVYFYELIEYMLLERNAFDSIAFFSQCEHVKMAPARMKPILTQYIDIYVNKKSYKFQPHKISLF